MTEASANYGTADLRRLQSAVAHWHNREFPDGATPTTAALVLSEEVGEVARCVVKAQQGIRGGAEHWDAELQKECADVLIALCSLAEHAGIDLASAVGYRWEQVRHREWNGMKEPYHPCECGSQRSEHRYGVYGCRQDKSPLPNPCDGFKLADSTTEWAVVSGSYAPEAEPGDKS